MITKADAAKTWTMNDEVVLKSCEARIDEAIRRSDGLGVFVDMHGLGLTSRIKDRVTVAYQQGGWSVTWESGDQRDPGPFLRLS